MQNATEDPNKVCHTAAEVGFDPVALESPAMQEIVQMMRAELSPAQNTAVFTLCRTFRWFVHNRADGMGKIAMALIGAELQVLADLEERGHV